MQTRAYPSVNPELFAEVVQRMQLVGNPLKIVLFGSQARGEAHVNSDLDLLVVEESDRPRYQRAPLLPSPSRHIPRQRHYRLDSG